MASLQLERDRCSVKGSLNGTPPGPDGHPGRGVPYRCSANCSGEGPLSGTLEHVNGTRVGYARCSTDEQDVIVQTEQLLALGVPQDRIYIDRGFSGTTRRNRAGLDQALAAVWDGTVFTVTKFDRFARNMAEANDLLTDLSGRGVHFGLGASVYDWSDPFGRLFLQTLAMVAEFEANIGHQRTREGMALAKKNGRGCPGR
nr:recombinase family protein [Nonomuraea sp. K271]